MDYLQVITVLSAMVGLFGIVFNIYARTGKHRIDLRNEVNRQATTTKSFVILILLFVISATALVEQRGSSNTGGQLPAPIVIILVFVVLLSFLTAFFSALKNKKPKE